MKCLKMIRYLFIGSVDYSAYCLEALFNMDIDIISVMCPVKEAAKINTDYSDLGNVVQKFGRSVYYFSKIKDEVEYIKQNRPDVIFVLGLSQIVPISILKIPTIGCIGSHPALLPQNRGRHPIIWAIANGLKKSGITFFWLDEGVDSGDIWVQKEFNIDKTDDASSIYKQVKILSVEMLKQNIPDLEKGEVKRAKQDNSKASYWRKRSYKDGEIDWRMSSERINNLVRALTYPYAGAHAIYKQNEVKIWKIKILNDMVERYLNMEPGKIIYVNKNNMCVTVKTGDGAVEIVKHNFVFFPEVGAYL